MKKAVTVFCLSVSCSTLYALHPRAVESYKESINRALENPTIDNAIKLANQLTSLARHLDRTDSSAVEIYKETQAALLSIPGHAEYYQYKILQAQERVKTRGVPSLHEYRSEIMYGFQTLPHLSSPEGVRVLGELLSNDWVPPGNETAPLSGKFVPLSVSATVTLPKFPLVDKPFKDPITNENIADANAAWLLWYEEIKSGKRTFRFEGDPTEYDLNGPAPGQKLTRIARDTARDAERAAGRKKNGTDPAPAANPTPGSESHSSAVAIAVIAFGLVLLGALFWHFSRIRKMRSS